MKDSNKTTSLHFELFKVECRKWVEVFGLKGWQIHFEHNGKKDNSRASCTYDVVDRSVSFILQRDWDRDDVTNREVRFVALHEVLELLLSSLSNLAGFRYTTKLEIEEEVHVIIRTLENILFKERG